MKNFMNSDLELSLDGEKISFATCYVSSTMEITNSTTYFNGTIFLQMLQVMKKVIVIDDKLSSSKTLFITNPRGLKLQFFDRAKIKVNGAWRVARAINGIVSVVTFLPLGAQSFCKLF